MSPSSRWSLGHIYTPHRPPVHPSFPPPRLFHLPHKAQSQVLHAFPSFPLYSHMTFLLIKKKAPSVSASILIRRSFFQLTASHVCPFCSEYFCLILQLLTISISTVSGIASKKTDVTTVGLALWCLFIWFNPLIHCHLKDEHLGGKYMNKTILEQWQYFNELLRMEVFLLTHILPHLHLANEAAEFLKGHQKRSALPEHKMCQEIIQMCISLPLHTGCFASSWVAEVENGL